MHRAKSNPMLGECEYQRCIEAWLNDNPVATPDSLLGPLIQSPQQITVAVLVRASPLVDRFVSSGCSQCILLNSRLESALMNVLDGRPSICKAGAAYTQAHLITQHVMTVCKYFRTFAREDSKPGKQRRFPKTGAIRRKLGVSWAVIRPLISKIELPVTSGT